MSTPDYDPSSEIHEFASLLRATVTSAFLGDPVKPGPDDHMWNAVYGRVEVEAANMEEVAERLGALVRRKTAAAAWVAMALAMKVSDLEEKSLMQVLDETEREIIQSFSDT